MTAPRFAILIEDNAWRICRVEASQVQCTQLAESDDRSGGRHPESSRAVGGGGLTSGTGGGAGGGGAIIEALRRFGWDGSPLALGLPSSWCLAASIETGADRHRPSLDAMAYQLEDRLPIAAEAFVADFLPASTPAPGSPAPGSPGSGSGGEDRRLGVCVELDRVRPVVDMLAAEGVAVDLIAPTTMLAVQCLLHEGGEGPAAADRQVCVLPDADHHELVVLDRRVPVTWSVHDDEASVRRARIVAGVEAAPTALLNSQSHEQAARMAALVLEDRVQPWLNLRRGALAPGDRWQRLRTPVHAALVAASVLLTSVTAVMLYWTHQCDALARRDRATQADVFKQALPDQRVPVNPRSRLISEHRRLVGLIASTSGDGGDAGVSSSDVAAAVASSALHDLVGVLAALPDGLRYRVLDLRVEPGRIYIDGQARALSDPDTIAASLTAGGFETSPPRTQRLKDQGVGFVLTATPAPAPAPGRGGDPALAPERASGNSQVQGKGAER